MSDAGSSKISKEIVPVGKVIKAHSLRGEIKVYPFSGSPEIMLRYKELLLATEDGTSPLCYQVEHARVQKNSVLFQLKGCGDRNAAEKLVQARVYVHTSALPKLEPDEFYLRDLEGKLLKTEDGRTVGRVTGFLMNGLQDLICVTGDEEEYLIPLVPEFLQAINEEEVTVSLPQGLLEINS